MDLSRKKRNWKRLDENCIWDTVCYWPFNHSLVFLFAEQPNLISSLQFLQQRYQAQLFQCQWKLYIKFKSWNISKPISFTNWSMWTPEFPVKLEFTFWCVTYRNNFCAWEKPIFEPYFLESLRKIAKIGKKPQKIKGASEHRWFLFVLLTDDLSR